MPDATRLILASGSAARKAMLEAAGLTFEVIPADVDEAAIRDAMTNTKVPPQNVPTLPPPSPQKKPASFQKPTRTRSLSAPIRCWRWAARYLPKPASPAEAREHSRDVAWSDP